MAIRHILKPVVVLQNSEPFGALQVFSQEIFMRLKTITGPRKAGCKEIAIISRKSTES